MTADRSSGEARVAEIVEIVGNEIRDIVARRVVIRPGSSLTGNVRAASLVVEGHFRGVAKVLKGEVSMVEVAKGGVLEGSAHVNRVRVSGKVRGILHASEVKVTEDSEVVGGILADVFVNTSGAQCRALTFVGPGMAGPSSQGLLQGLRSVVDLNFAKFPVPVSDPEAEAEATLDVEFERAFAEFDFEDASPAAPVADDSPSPSTPPRGRMPFLVAAA